MAQFKSTSEIHLFVRSFIISFLKEFADKDLQMEYSARISQIILDDVINEREHSSPFVYR